MYRGKPSPSGTVTVGSIRDQRLPIQRGFIMELPNRGVDASAMMGTRWACALANVMCAGLLWGCGSVYAQHDISVHKLATRAGVTLEILLIKPPEPVATILFFPGGGGRIRFAADGSTSFQGYPARNPVLLAIQGLLTAVMGAPSDLPSGPQVRDSPELAEDVRHVMDFLRSQTALPIWLVGHSSGTTAVANAAIRLNNQGMAGLVLMSSKTGRPDTRTGYLDILKLNAISVPVLVVSHKDDACSYTLHTHAVRLVRRFSKAPKAELMTFRGGGPAEGDPCGSRHFHGFPGLANKVSARMAQWIRVATTPLGQVVR